jgi:hypothetical protein
MFLSLADRFLSCAALALLLGMATATAQQQTNNFEGEKTQAYLLFHEGKLLRAAAQLRATVKQAPSAEARTPKRHPRDM